MASALVGPGSGAASSDGFRRHWATRAAAHSLGGMVGGLVLGAMLAIPVLVFANYVWLRVGVSLLVAATALVFSVQRFAPRRGVGSGWQVPRGRRLRRFGPVGTMAIWGALLGSGVLTVIPHAAALLLPAYVVASGSPAVAVLAGATYGLSRSLLAVATSRRSTDPTYALELLVPLTILLRRTGLYVTTVLCCLVVLVAVAA